MADEANNRIRKVAAGTGIITTVAEMTNFGKAMADSKPAPGFGDRKAVAVDSAGISTSPTPWTLGYKDHRGDRNHYDVAARATVLPAEMAGRL